MTEDIKKHKEKMIFYSKVGCSPCDFWFDMFKRKFKEDEYEKIVLQSNEEALEVTQ